MPSERIIEMLEAWGIPFNKAEFLEDAKACLGAHDIYERWEERFVITAEGYDVDFVWMACEVLWERLVKGKASTEQIDDLMQNGYDLIEDKSGVAGCMCWLVAWDKLKLRFTKEMKSVRDAESVFRGTQCLFNWCQDLEMELGNAATDDGSLYEHRILYCREFCKLFPASDDDIIHHMRTAIAESLFESGKQEEGEKEFQDIVNEYPDNPWGYIIWGDMYRGFFGSTSKNPERAEGLYRKALGLDAEEDETVLERIEDLKKK